MKYMPAPIVCLVAPPTLPITRHRTVDGYRDGACLVKSAR